MAQMTKELAQAIVDGDGYSRNEVEQLAHFFLKNAREDQIEDFRMASLEGDELVIRLNLAILPDVVKGTEGIGEPGNYPVVYDAASFSRDLIRELNREDEAGNTPITRLFDRAIIDAIDKGADGIYYNEEA